MRYGFLSSESQICRIGGGAPLAFLLKDAILLALLDDYLFILTVFQNEVVFLQIPYSVDGDALLIQTFNENRRDKIELIRVITYRMNSDDNI